MSVAAGPDQTGRAWRSIRKPETLGSGTVRCDATGRFGSAADRRRGRGEGGREGGGWLLGCLEGQFVKKKMILVELSGEGMAEPQRFYRRPQDGRLGGLEVHYYVRV